MSESFRRKQKKRGAFCAALVDLTVSDRGISGSAAFLLAFSPGASACYGSVPVVTSDPPNDRLKSEITGSVRSDIGSWFPGAHSSASFLLI